MLRMFYLEFLHIPKREHVPEKVFMTRITLSILAMLTCLVILCSTTYAYFTATVTAGFEIETANYELAIAIDDEPLSDDGTGKFTYTCSFDAQGSEYVFTLTASGTATTGYCKVMIGEKVYFTDQITTAEGGNTLTLKIHANAGTLITFEPSWGTSTAFAMEEATYGGATIISCATEGDPYAETTEGTEDPEEPETDEEYILHIVAEGETLESIATLYGTTVSAICEYSNIMEGDELTVGQELRIPNVTGDIPAP